MARKNNNGLSGIIALVVLAVGGFFLFKKFKNGILGGNSQSSPLIDLANSPVNVGGGYTPPVTVPTAPVTISGMDKITSSSNNPVLRMGSKGADVRTLQLKLNEFGFQLDVDGVFGQLTDNAVRDFQKTAQLAVDGIVGAQTWAVLNNPYLSYAFKKS